MRSVHSKHLLSFLAIPTIALAAFLGAQSSNAIRGDVNNDGQVTTLDALAVMSHVVGKTLPTGYTMVPNGDANGDGQVTAADALVILSYVVGKDVSQFPVGKGLVTLSVTPTSATIARGETRQLSASVAGATNTAVTWRSSAESVATVSGSGLVTGVAPGEATITAISQADTLAKATARITVTQAAASNLVLVSGNAQSATVGTQLPNALVVRVTDAAGNSVSGATVAWAVTSGGGTITQTGATDSNGQAVATWRLGNTAGTQTATATVEGRSVTFTATANPGAPARLESLNGGGQTAPAGATLPTALLVRVVDPHGNAVPGVNVTWTPAAGSGSVNPTVSATNNEGFAGSEWTVGTEAGEDSVTASAPGLPSVTFRATVTAGSPSKLTKVSGDSATATVGAALPTPLIVRVLDANNNPVSGATVTWNVTSGGGTITQTSITGASGQASANWTLGTGAGTQTAAASVGDLSASFTATATAGAAARLVKVSGDTQVGPVNTPLQDSLVVRVTDQHGNPVAGVPVGWSLASAGGAVSPATSITNAAGLAKTRLTFGTAPGTNVVTASASGLQDVTFTANATAGSASNLLKISGDQQTGPIGQALGNALVVRVTDASGNPVIGITVTWSVTTGGGTITQTVATDAAGHAAAQWTLGTLVESPQTAKASVGSQTVTFTATGQLPTTAVVRKVGGDVQTANAGERLADSLAVVVELADGRRIVGATVNWTTAAGSGTVAPSAVKTDEVGRATAAWTIGRNGPQTATATVQGLSPVTFQASVRPGAPAGIMLTGGNQFTPAGSVAEIAAQVVDADGNLIPGQLVRWSTSGGGSVAPTESLSDAEGVARTTVTFPTRATDLDVIARSGDVSSLRRFPVVAAPAAKVTLSQDTATIRVGEVRSFLVVGVVDQYGNQVVIGSHGRSMRVRSANDSIASAMTPCSHGGRTCIQVFARTPGTTLIIATVDAAEDTLQVTVAPPPTAGNMTTTGAVVMNHVGIPLGTATPALLEHSMSNSLSTITATSSEPARSGTTDHPVSATLMGLAPHTTYSTMSLRHSAPGRRGAPS